MNELPNTIRILERNKGKVLACYILYTIAKIAAVVISLATTGTTAKYGIDLFLIIYLAVDGYELLFFLVLGIFYYCGNVPISFSMTRGIQVILEVARLSLVTIMLVGISRNLELLDNAAGIVGFILVNIEYTKAVCFVAYIAANFKKIRRIYIQNLGLEPSRIEAQEKLEPYAKISEKEGSCAICLEPVRVNTVCVILPCDHSYHHICLKNWVVIRCICPMCRTII